MFCEHKPYNDIMNIARSITRWLLALGISAALSLWIFLATINATIANREVTKSWLASSGAYDNALGSALRVSTSNQQDGSLVTPDLLQTAFVQTFDGPFIQQSAHTVIDATYNWAEGTADAITFSLPVQEKAAAFRTNLAALVVPKLEALPKCATRLTVSDPNKITCLPHGIKPAEYASQLTQPSNEGNFLNTPLTQEAFAQAPQLPWLPTAVQWLHTLIWALPVALLGMVILYVLASPDKLRGISRAARRLTIGAAISLIGGLFLWYTASAVDLSGSIDAGDPQQKAIVATLINPLARSVLPDVGRALSLYSGIVVAIAGSAWLGAFIWRHKHGPNVPKHPTIPSSLHTHEEATLPPPTGRPSA
jgi:hypothetical protein